MTKKIFLAAVLFFTIWFINSSCKKTPDTPPIVSPTVNHNVTSAGDPIGTFSGLFVEALLTNGGIQATFYSTPTSLHLSTSIVAPKPTGTVTSVYCNNTQLVVDTAGPYYSSSFPAIAFPPALWVVNGNTNFPSFTYTCTTDLPSYNGANLPTTINRDQNVTIPIQGATNYDQIIINIGDMAGHYTSNLAASSSATPIVCPKDSLATLIPTTNGYISAKLFKYTPQTINGKNYLFITTITYTKNYIVIQ